MDKPFSQACENNKQPILELLKPAFATVESVLEVGTGTGQHAVYFADQMPHLTWHCSDLIENHPGIHAWLAEYAGANLRPPREFDVNQAWPALTVDAVYTANTLHIMSWQSVQSLFAGLPAVLNTGAWLAVYGPFNYDGKFTSDSNASFDQWLKEIDPERGIRDFEAIDALARAVGLTLLSDHAMPANNRLLMWQAQG